MPPELTVVVVQVGPAGWTPLCSQHGPESTWVGSPWLASYFALGHIAAYHRTPTRRTTQETR